MYCLVKALRQFIPLVVIQPVAARVYFLAILYQVFGHLTTSTLLLQCAERLIGGSICPPLTLPFLHFQYVLAAGLSPVAQ